MNIISVLFLTPTLGGYFNAKPHHISHIYNQSNNIKGLSECEYAVSVNGQSMALDLTPLSTYTIVMEEQSPDDAWYLQYTPCQNNVQKSCYNQKVMAAQMYGSSDAKGTGILGIWDNKNAQPVYSNKDGNDMFTFQWGPIQSCDAGCDGGRHFTVNYICDSSATPYDKSQSRFYETAKENGVCEYNLDLYTSYACPKSLPPTILPTPAPTRNSTGSCSGSAPTCSGTCAGAICVNENGNGVWRYVVSTDTSAVSIFNNNQGSGFGINHNSQIQIAKQPASSYSPYEFMEYKLAGKTLTYTTDLSAIGCSCNSALYMVTMPGYGSDGNPTPGQYGDYYCDSNDVGGVWCWEMDIQEANKYVTATTPHSCDQNPGGPIYNCDRGGCGTNSHNVNAGGLCPGCTIDTNSPFQYSITFNSDSMHVKLSQNGKTFEYDACGNGGYISNFQKALDYGMVIVASYWGSDYNTMSWLDGNTGCGGDCSGSGQAKFWNFIVS